MQKIIWLNSAVSDIVRLRNFLALNNPTAAKKAAQTIQQATTKLQHFPNTGIPVLELTEYRDLYIRFGAAGYVMRYRIDQDNIYIVHIRHYRESNFKNTAI